MVPDVAMVFLLYAFRAISIRLAIKFCANAFGAAGCALLLPEKALPSGKRLPGNAKIMPFALAASP
jgi:hypothetical protein